MLSTVWPSALSSDHELAAQNAQPDNPIPRLMECKSAQERPLPYGLPWEALPGHAAAPSATRLSPVRRNFNIRDGDHLAWRIASSPSLDQGTAFEQPAGHGPRPRAAPSG